jgi:hypothetical protein
MDALDACLGVGALAVVALVGGAAFASGARRREGLAYEEGRAAGYTYARRSENPYPDGAEHQRWDAGFVEVRRNYGNPYTPGTPEYARWSSGLMG